MRVAAKLTELSGETFTTAPNKFEALAAHDAMLNAHPTGARQGGRFGRVLRRWHVDKDIAQTG